MENYKVLVRDEAESKDAQDLFFELGGKWNHHEGYYLLMTYPNSIRLHKSGEITQGIESDIIYKECKEITMPQLRDLVVLRRNDVADATHTHGEYSFYVGVNGNYFFNKSNSKWEATWKSKDILKPIEKKEMKEYLRKNSNGTYSYIGTVQPENVSNFMIEIPEGSNIAVIEDSKVKFYSKYTSADLDYLGKDLIWIRPSLPEELPFIDDEPKYNPNDIDLATGYDLDAIARTHGYRNRDVQESCLCYRESLKIFIERKPSLNDQYAEIKKVRQSAWAKQEGGSHYKNLKIQPMQYALENKLDYAQANVVKYVTRHADKNGKEDLLKAIHNIELMIEFYYGEPK